jgi:hypothetical protein
MAAASDERRWEDRHIIGWSDWVGSDNNHKHAVMVLDDGTH